MSFRPELRQTTEWFRGKSEITLLAGSVQKKCLDVAIARLGYRLNASPSGTQLLAQHPHDRVATSESWRDKATGERKEKTEWPRVVIFNENLCRIAEQYLKKGSKVFIEGQLQTRKWQDQSGQDRYSTEVVLQGFRGSSRCSIVPAPVARGAPISLPMTRVVRWARLRQRPRRRLRAACADRAPTWTMRGALRAFIAPAFASLTCNMPFR